jgi:hypothetical protein
MHLVQILLPLYAPGGERLPQARFEAVRKELVERFGGLTAYSRAPVTGLWKDQGAGAAPVERDEIVVYEVMVDGLDRAWWASYREQLAARFEQQELVVRAQPVELL